MKKMMMIIGSSEKETVVKAEVVAENSIKIKVEDNLKKSEGIDFLRTAVANYDQLGELKQESFIL